MQRDASATLAGCTKELKMIDRLADSSLGMRPPSARSSAWISQATGDLQPESKPQNLSGEPMMHAKFSFPYHSMPWRISDTLDRDKNSFPP
jgi:hypothetical protein